MVDHTPPIRALAELISRVAARVLQVSQSPVVTTTVTPSSSSASEVRCQWESLMFISTQPAA